MAYTAAQWAILLSDADDAKLCFKMTRDVEADLLYCSGGDPVSISTDDYIPREMQFDALTLGDPSRTGLKIGIDDADSVVRTAWYAERFSGNACLVTLLLKLKSEGAWTSVYEVEWKVRYGGYRRNGEFDIELHAAVGLRPRSGLLVGSRGEFQYAPEPGASIRVGSYSAGIGGSSGGTAAGWNPTPWGS